jgi:hypothetical protein
MPWSLLEHGWTLEAVGLFALIVVVMMILVAVGQSMAKELTATLEATLVSRANLTTLSEALQSEDPSLHALLLNKFKATNATTQHHFRMVRDFCGYAFMQMTMLVGCSGIAAISLLLFARKGWTSDDSVPLLILFATTATAAGIFAALPRMFSMNDNIRSNVLAYARSMELCDRIQTFAYADPKSDPAIAAFLDRLDQELASSRTIAFAFDLSKAPGLSMLYADLATSLGISKTQRIQGTPDSPASIPTSLKSPEKPKHKKPEAKKKRPNQQ